MRGEASGLRAVSGGWTREPRELEGLLEFVINQAFDAFGERASLFVGDLHIACADQHTEGDGVTVKEFAKESRTFVAQEGEGVFVLCAVCGAVGLRDLAAASVGVFSHDIPDHQATVFVFLIKGFQANGLLFTARAPARVNGEKEQFDVRIVVIAEFVQGAILAGAEGDIEAGIPDIDAVGAGGKVDGGFFGSDFGRGFGGGFRSGFGRGFILTAIGGGFGGGFGIGLGDLAFWGADALVAFFAVEAIVIGATGKAARGIVTGDQGNKGGRKDKEGRDNSSHNSILEERRSVARTDR